MSEKWVKKPKILENGIEEKKGEKNEQKEKTMTYWGNEIQFLNRFPIHGFFDDTCLRSMVELAIYPIPMSTCRQSLRVGLVLEPEIYTVKHIYSHFIRFSKNSTLFV